MPHDLEGKRIIVTGGSRGLGRALAREAAARGARVAITAARAESADRAGRELPVVGAFAVDQLDPGGAAAAMGGVVAALGGAVDALVNNAALLGERTPLAEYPLDVWQDVMRASVDGVLAITQAVLPAMADGGAIINVTSGAAGRRGWGAYSISKLAINGMTQMLRDELAARQIRCVAINPGPMRTEMRAAAYPDEDPARLPEPADVLAPFLAVMAGADPGWFVEAATWRP